MPQTFRGDGVPPLTDKPGTPKIRLGKQMVMRWGAININGGYSGKKVELAETASKMGLDVLAVSDIRVRGEKEEEVGEYKVYLSGVKAGIAQWGVGLYIRKEMEPSVVAIRYVNDRLMWIDLTVSSKKIRIVSVYSHCEGTEQDKMDSFYEVLSDVVVRVKDKDSVLLMGDFNARIGNRTEGYEKVMGKFGEDMEANRNEKQLLDFCASMGLVITNSFFKHKNIHRMVNEKSPSQYWRTVLPYELWAFVKGLEKVKWIKDLLPECDVHNIEDRWYPSPPSSSRKRVLPNKNQ
ncbi:craniofacial development protein 2-like [Schistocerca cancellata]|uniref:craniofacial development protein 2-like n=1 Tax=Schistocerca cancellata TaxID=274614 RepID=UPI002117EC93|nr:craniofacial development protein 2-like [Schistocerca cancellata]